MKISNQIDYFKDELEKYKFLATKFKDLQSNTVNNCFSSKKVNKSYTHYNFITTHSGLYFEPFVEVSYKTEIIKIYSQPVRNKLAYVDYYCDSIKFCKLQANLKNRKFRDGLLADCQQQICNFIESKKDYKIDSTHLDPRLKTLINFI
jgi:hypothetical protein